MGDKQTVTFYMTHDEIKLALGLVTKTVEQLEVDKYTALAETFMEGFLELGYSRAVAGKLAADAVNATLR